jgi:hypothetical protein
MIKWAPYVFVRLTIYLLAGIVSAMYLPFSMVDYSTITDPVFCTGIHIYTLASAGKICTDWQKIQYIVWAAGVYNYMAWRAILLPINAPHPGSPLT